MPIELPSRLLELGWTDTLQSSLDALGDASLDAARILADHGIRFLVAASSGTYAAPLATSLRKAGREIAVGDWVAVRPSDGAVVAVLERRSAISRRTSESATKEQVLAANVDLVCIATAVDGDFNLRRLERLLTLAYQSGADPIVVLTKADLGDAARRRQEVETIAPGVPVVAVSAVTGCGLDELRAQLGAQRTAVLLGQSGVGKSTLVNLLAGREALRTGTLHRTGRGRHTTSHRELLQLPDGGAIIDTPGLREVQLWEGDDALEQTFGDIDDLAASCRFSDCAHAGEPGCAIAAALADGTLVPERWTSYQKLQRELAAVERRVDQRARGQERRRWQTLQREAQDQAAAKRLR
ncbi:MAG: ribosome small subunit-dependent GTPase A [Candidatus Dormiibacterota bacterium]